MKNKVFLCFAVFLCFGATGLKAQTQNIVSELETPKAGEGTVRVVCDPKIIELLGTPATSLRPYEEENFAGKSVGYRIQIYMDNTPKAKNEALRIESLFNEAFPDLGTYVRYNAPNWKALVGDFRTKEEAEMFKQKIQSALPEFGKEMYVVPSRINFPTPK
jgi:hypothetical protein